jgi:hypothetical protein
VSFLARLLGLAAALGAEHELPPAEGAVPIGWGESRGIVNARKLGLSRHKYRRPKPPNRKLQRKRAQLALCSRRPRLAGES